MSISQNRIFCFNHGSECRVFDFITKENLKVHPLPDISHHNNAQFLNLYYDTKDKYPLLLLSRGDYPRSHNEVYVVRVFESDGEISFKVIKTIHNTLNEAMYNGSWVVDQDQNKLFLYTMSIGD